MKTCLLCGDDKCQNIFTIISPKKEIIFACEDCMEDFFRFVNEGKAEEVRMNRPSSHTNLENTKKLVSIGASVWTSTLTSPTNAFTNLKDVIKFLETPTPFPVVKSIRQTKRKPSEKTIDF